MASTTTEPAWVTPRSSAALAAPRPRDGFAILADIVCMVGIPVGPGAELEALNALARRLERSAVSGPEAISASALREHLGRLSASQVEAILEWLSPRDAWWQFHHRSRCRQLARIRLLFVLAVAAGAHAYRHEAL